MTDLATKASVVTASAGVTVNIVTDTAGRGGSGTMAIDISRRMTALRSG